MDKNKTVIIISFLVTITIMFIALAASTGIESIYSNNFDYKKDNIHISNNLYDIREAFFANEFLEEYQIIKEAAIRNDLDPNSQLFCVLLAIRKAENGGPGKEFGIMNDQAKDLDSQAGWSAASVVKSYIRWINDIDNGLTNDDFITHMGKRYCPPDVHELNRNWVPNVTSYTLAYLNLYNVRNPTLIRSGFTLTSDMKTMGIFAISQ